MTLLPGPTILDASSSRASSGDPSPDRPLPFRATGSPPFLRVGRSRRQPATRSGRACPSSRASAVAGHSSTLSEAQRDVRAGTSKAAANAGGWDWEDEAK